MTSSQLTLDPSPSHELLSISGTKSLRLATNCRETTRAATSGLLPPSYGVEYRMGASRSVDLRRPSVRLSFRWYKKTTRLIGYTESLHGRRPISSITAIPTFLKSALDLSRPIQPSQCPHAAFQIPVSTSRFLRTDLRPASLPRSMRDLVISGYSRIFRQSRTMTRTAWAVYGSAVPDSEGGTSHTVGTLPVIMDPSFPNELDNLERWVAPHLSAAY